MRVVLGFRDASELQKYAAEMLRRAPPKRKADLVARAVYAYLGGKDCTADDLAVLLTGKPSAGNKSPVQQKKVKSKKTVKTVAEKAVDTPQEPQEAIEEPVLAVDRSSEPEYSAADAAMMCDVMAAFAAGG